MLSVFIDINKGVLYVLGMDLYISRFGLFSIISLRLNFSLGSRPQLLFTIIINKYDLKMIITFSNK